MVVKTPADLAKQARMLGKKTISYSQISQFSTCPRRWKLRYIDGHKVYEPSVYTVFGTSMHETVQHYLTMVYKATAKAADEFDHHDYLKNRMRENFKQDVEQSGSTFSSPAELNDFYLDGLEIIDYIKKKRGVYFTKKNSELLGVELPILIETDCNDKVMIMGFVDLVIKEGDTIRIIDIKTSRATWTKNQKKQNGLQLRLYKKYFAKQYEVNESDIEVEYFILKRKIWNTEFAQSRVQVYKPSAGKPSINKSDKVLSEFVDHAFTQDGKKNADADYPAIPGNKREHCKYCPFKDKPELCPEKDRIQILSE